MTTGGEGELAAIELIVVAMTEAGLDRQDSVRFYGVLSSYIISFAAAQAAADVAGDDDSDPAWIGVTLSLARTGHPAVAAVRTSWRPTETATSTSPACRSSWTRSRRGARPLTPVRTHRAAARTTITSGRSATICRHESPESDEAHTAPLRVPT